MKLPLLDWLQVDSALSRVGFAETSRKGSHLKMTHEDGRAVVFPDHFEIDRSTLKAVLQGAGVTPGDFLDGLK